MAPSLEVVLRAVGTALAGLSVAFAVYMLAYGGGKSRINGLQYLAIFAQPRGAGATPGSQSPSTPPEAGAALVDLTRTGTLASPSAGPRQDARRVEILAASADRAWLRIDGAIRPVAPGEMVEGLGRVGAIVSRGGGWAVLDDKGVTLLMVAKDANATSVFARKMIFE